MHLSDVIIQPIASEKVEMLRQNNVYAFEINRKANRKMVSQAIHSIYGHKPVKVNILYKKSKTKRNQTGFGRTPLKKKAYVFFDKKAKVGVFETV